MSPLYEAAVHTPPRPGISKRTWRRFSGTPSVDGAPHCPLGPSLVIVWGPELRAGRPHFVSQSPGATPSPTRTGRPLCRGPLKRTRPPDTPFLRPRSPCGERSWGHSRPRVCVPPVSPMFCFCLILMSPCNLSNYHLSVCLPVSTHRPSTCLPTYLSISLSLQSIAVTAIIHLSVYHQSTSV